MIMAPEKSGATKPTSSPPPMSFKSLANWLESIGFKLQNTPRLMDNPLNNAKWIACRSLRSQKHCECNGKNLQIVVLPYDLFLPDGRHIRTCEVELTGEHCGIWYNFKAYSLSPDELKTSFEQIEVNLAKAWNNF